MARRPRRGTIFLTVPTFVLLVLLAVLAPGAALAESSGAVSAEHVQVELVSDVTHVRPGEPVPVGLRFELEDGWHVYWANPGDSGLAPTVRWQLPEGTTVGELQWPYPERIAVGPLVNYGYEGEVLLPVEVTPPASLRDGDTLRLAARADWLVCKEDCIPGRADLTLELPVSGAPVERDWRWAGAFDEARAKLPRSTPVQARIEAEQHDDRIELRIADAPDGEIVFFPLDPDLIENAAPQPLTREGGVATLALTPSQQRREPATRLRGTLVAEHGFAPEGAPALAIDLPVRVAVATMQQDGATRAAAAAASSSSADDGALSLRLALVFAFLGGLLLNVMPCVFPVLSIKVLDFVRRAGDSAARLRLHGLVYAAGVLLSFWILAGALLALRAGGESLGWGFQLQSPAFVVAMIFLLFTLAASLLGVFDIGLGLTALAGRVGQGEGLAGSFATGVLATAVATPCTAPFMGPALGFAVTLPAGSALAVFTALGVGMALPYVVLCFVPGLLRLLPRPGAWLETFKQAMAFPLLATVVWLVWVLGLQAGVDAILGVLIGLLLLTVGLWVRARFAGLAQRNRRLALAVSVVLGFAGLATALALRDGVGGAAAVAADERGAEHDLYGNVWQPWSEAAVERLLASGTPVFVDFTAAWCLTCKVNEHVVFSSQEVRDAFAERGVALLRADWTSRDDTITRALASFGRSGVPLYVLYPESGAEPVILPSVLTRGIVLDALAQVGESRRAERPRSEPHQGGT
ncbi:MAG TPA: thioredoxin family protein [Candidatus Binatia bacterium]